MDEPLTEEELDEIARRAAAATSGPWEAGVRYERFGVNEGVRPGEGPYSFLPPGRCFWCAESGETALAMGRDRRGAVYHVHRIVADPDSARARWRTISSAATHEPVVESGEGKGLSGILRRDAEFIARAREDVPRLVAEVRRLRAALEAQEEVRGGAGAARRPREPSPRSASLPA